VLIKKWVHREERDSPGTTPFSICKRFALASAVNCAPPVRFPPGKVVSLEQYRNTVTSEPVMPATAADPGPFVAPKLYVSDVTIERLAVLLKAQPQGMLMLSDELAGLKPPTLWGFRSFRSLRST
jgi:hypothetical protein